MAETLLYTGTVQMHSYCYKLTCTQLGVGLLNFLQPLIRTYKLVYIMFNKKMMWFGRLAMVHATMAVDSLCHRLKWIQHCLDIINNLEYNDSKAATCLQQPALHTYCEWLRQSLGLGEETHALIKYNISSLSIPTFAFVFSPLHYCSPISCIYVLW